MFATTSNDRWNHHTQEEEETIVDEKISSCETYEAIPLCIRIHHIYICCVRRNITCNEVETLILWECVLHNPAATIIL